MNLLPLSSDEVHLAQTLLGRVDQLVTQARGEGVRDPVAVLRQLLVLPVADVAALPLLFPFVPADVRWLAPPVQALLVGLDFAPGVDLVRLMRKALDLLAALETA